MFALLLATFHIVDDGSGAFGVGGTVMPLGSHRSVRMESEVVRASLPSGIVTTRFVFKNTGPKCEVVMIFPETGGVGAANEGPPERTYFTYFRSWVDGKPIKVARMPQKGETEHGMSYENWWVKRVPFGANQRRVVVNKYQSPPGWGGAGEPPTSTFCYVLETGASWKGTIGSAIIEVDISRIKKRSSITAEPEGYKRKGTKLIWTLKNVEPTVDQDIFIRWRD